MGAASTDFALFSAMIENGLNSKGGGPRGGWEGRTDEKAFKRLKNLDTGRCARVRSRIFWPLLTSLTEGVLPNLSLQGTKTVTSAAWMKQSQVTRHKPTVSSERAWIGQLVTIGALKGNK